MSRHSTQLRPAVLTQSQSEGVSASSCSLALQLMSAVMSSAAVVLFVERSSGWRWGFCVGRQFKVSCWLGGGIWLVARRRDCDFFSMNQLSRLTRGANYRDEGRLCTLRITAFCKKRHSGDAGINGDSEMQTAFSRTAGWRRIAFHKSCFRRLPPGLIGIRLSAPHFRT